MKWHFFQDMNRRLIAFLSSLVALAALGAGLLIAERPSSPSPVRAAVANQPFAQTSSTVTAVTTTSSASTSTNALVTHVVDGDTFDVRIDGGINTERVRMLGIDTPETVDPRKAVQCYGKEASNRLKQLLDGTRVRLEGDPMADEQDRYGRLLRNVYLEDGTDVNATLVLEGYAHAYLTFPLDRDRKHLLSDLENEAQAAKRGLWDPLVCPV